MIWSKSTSWRDTALKNRNKTFLRLGIQNDMGTTFVSADTPWARLKEERDVTTFISIKRGTKQSFHYKSRCPGNTGNVKMEQQKETPVEQKTNYQQPLLNFLNRGNKYNRDLLRAVHSETSGIYMHAAVVLFFCYGKLFPITMMIRPSKSNVDLMWLIISVLAIVLIHWEIGISANIQYCAFLRQMDSCVHSPEKL